MQKAIANRNVADDNLDDIAQNARLQLASRSIEAAKDRSYIDIFPDGIGYYTAASLAQEETRYNELKTRLRPICPRTTRSARRLCP